MTMSRTTIVDLLQLVVPEKVPAAIIEQDIEGGVAGVSHLSTMVPS